MILCDFDKVVDNKTAEAKISTAVGISRDTVSQFHVCGFAEYNGELIIRAWAKELHCPCYTRMTVAQCKALFEKNDDHKFLYDNVMWWREMGSNW